MPVFFPAFCEPLVATEKYLEFAQFREGQTVLDLGACSGLTSILCKRKVGQRGTVVAVEANPDNLRALRHNLQLFEAISSLAILVFPAAVWSGCQAVTFASEGNMGSSAGSLLDSRRGHHFRVESVDLSGIDKRLQRKAVDVIKCDTEGAEPEIFTDQAGFVRFRARIILEPHLISAELTAEKCRRTLSQYGYSCSLVEQPGVRTPLLQCSPPEADP